jgi:hypothetical protein
LLSALPLQQKRTSGLLSRHPFVRSNQSWQRMLATDLLYVRAEVEALQLEVADIKAQIAKKNQRVKRTMDSINTVLATLQAWESAHWRLEQ